MTSRPAASYDFYLAITDAILGFVGSVRRDEPAALTYDGMDLSHALEAALYFTCVHDPGLNALFTDPGDVRAASGLESALARLLAVERLAKGNALRSLRRRNALFFAARSIRRAVRMRRGNSAPHAHGAARARPILFFARSLRFARYFLPIARQLEADCAFLVPSGDGELCDAICGWGFACHRYTPVRIPSGTMGRLVDGYGRHLACEADSLKAVLQRVNARLVVVPEGNAPDDEVLARVAEQQGVASACVQQGWSPILHPAFHNMRYDAMLVWGEGFADLMAPANPQQRFIATGNFHLRPVPGERSRGILFLYQGFDQWMGGRAAADAMVGLTQDIARAHPEVPIFVRPHPVVPLPSDVRARLDAIESIRIESSKDVSLADAFAKSCISVSAYSTAILESVSSGVVPLILNSVGMPGYWPDVAGAGAGIEVREPGAAFRALQGLLGDPAALEAFQPPMEAFSARFFSHLGEGALRATVEALRKLAGPVQP